MTKKRQQTVRPFEAWPLTAEESTYYLWKSFVFMVYNGTVDHDEMMRHLFPQDDIKIVVRGGHLFAVVEALKRECLRNKVPLSNAVLAELAAASVVYNKALSISNINRIWPLIDELYAHQVRLDPAAIPPAEASLPETQREILSLLEGRALTGPEISKQLDRDLSRLQRDHLSKLKQSGRVVNSREIGGYYRPDSPPE